MGRICDTDDDGDDDDDEDGNVTPMRKVAGTVTVVVAVMVGMNQEGFDRG